MNDLIQGDSLYKSETVGSIMSTTIPVCRAHDTKHNIMQLLTSKPWDTIHDIYVVDANDKLHGSIPLQKLLRAENTATATSLAQTVEFFLDPEEDQEKAIFLALKNDVARIVVLDKKGHFLGVITSHTMINVMHDEHIEDTLITAGIHGKHSNITKLATSRINLVVSARAPWLIAGLVAGLGLGLISSFFEETLTKTVALAYFIPVVAYIANSVGAQSQAIAVRALAILKFNYALYLLKELAAGLILGIMVGILGGLGATLIAQSPTIGVVVGLSLVVSSTIASVLASLIPITLKAFGKDPALGSDPLGTAIQDMISVLVYLLFAVMLM